MIAGGAVLPAKELYACYREWFGENGEEPLSSTPLGNELRRRGYAKEKSGVVRYLGVRIRCGR